MESQQQMILLLIMMFFIGFATWIFLLKNFTITWLKVKFSGGKKLMIHVISPVGNYYVAGVYNKAHLEFSPKKRRDNKDPNRLIYVESIKDALYNSFGVRCIDVDDAKDSVYYRFNDSYKSVCGANTEYTDELVKTALAKPSEEGIGFFNAKTWQIIVIAGILICAGLAVMIYKDVKTIKEQNLALHDEHVGIMIELNTTNSNIQKLRLNGNNGIEILR